ncbi:MAG: hypothetical protein WBF77_12955 [Sulfurimonadaceae bacterium]
MKQIVMMACIAGLSTLLTGDDLRSAAQNPISSLISLPFQFSFDNGADNGNANILNVQPVYPVTYGEWNYVNRLIVPLIDSPGGLPGIATNPSSEPGPRERGLGDVNYSLFLSPTKVGSIIWGAGFSVSMPTATSDSLGSGKWSTGPTAVLLTQTSWGSLGALFRQIWSVAGESDRADVSQFLFEPFFNYNLKDGWYLTSDMVWSANWEADSGNEWTIPVGGGVGKMFKIGDQAVNSKLEAYANAVQPDGAPDWSIRYTFQLLFPK